MKAYQILLTLAIFSFIRAEAADESQAHPDEQKASEKPHWDYLDQENWGENYPLCSGKRQSPIDVVTDDIIFDPSLSLKFIDYNQTLDFNLKNTHHSVSVSPNPSQAPPTVQLSWLPDDFELQELHFHWGNGTAKGSEHMINHERAAAEMHMVHFKKGLTKEEIGNVENSVVVVGVFIETDAVEHNKLEGLVGDVSAVNGTDEVQSANNPSNLINLLPENHFSFYTYNGSLTTPPCYEVVTWIVLSSPVYMSDEKLNELSNLEYAGPDSSQKINSNHRDIQPLLDRSVYASFNVTESVTAEPTKDTIDDALPKTIRQRLADLRKMLIGR